jgi:hypothetical protein
MLLMRLSPSFFATRSARPRDHGRRDLVEAHLAEPRFEMKRVDDLLRALLRRLVLPADHPLVPERSVEPLRERRCLLLGFRSLGLRRAHFANSALLGLQGPDTGLREIVVRPGNTGRAEDAHLPAVGGLHGGSEEPTAINRVTSYRHR